MTSASMPFFLDRGQRDMDHRAIGETVSASPSRTTFALPSGTE